MVLIIPGLSDYKAVKTYGLITRSWQKPGRNIIIFNPKWRSDETYQKKMQRLLDIYDQNKTETNIIVATSAGAALTTALHVQRNDISRVITVAGKLKGIDPSKARYVKKVPTIIQTIETSEQALLNLPQQELNKYVSLQPAIDWVVPKQDTAIGGMATKTVPFVGHGASILLAMLLLVKKELL